MDPGSTVVLQWGLSGVVPNLIALAATLVLVLILVAIGGAVYRHVTGGIEWPEDREDDEDVRRGGDDDEWDYY